MRRTLLFTLACLLGLVSVKAQTYSTISSKDDLIAFRNQVNAGTYSYEGLTVTLTAEEIDLSGENWEPIGTADYPFKGTFDGDGKTISNLTVPATLNNIYRGLFGNLDGASIKNLTLSDVNINATGAWTRRMYTGGIAGYATQNTTIENCHVTSGAITGSETTDNNSNGESYTGGIIGSNRGNITLCSNSATISTTTNNEYNSYYLGGIAGYANGDKIDRCFNQGEILGEGHYLYIGGLVGLSYVPVTNCYNTGDISTTKTSSLYVGGIAGLAYNEVNDCYSYAKITGEGKEFHRTGGIVGKGDGATIKNCLSLSTELTGNENRFGFIFGEKSNNGITVENNYAWVEDKPTANYDGDLNGDLWSGAMTIDQPIEGWSADYWTIDDTDKYMPQLKGMTITQENVQNPLELIINCLSRLKAFRNKVNNGTDYAEKTVELVADIDLKDDEWDWEPIGNAFEKFFKGTFNGNGHTISNLKISATNTNYYRGLFGNINGAAINELILKDVLIESSFAVNTGALVATSANSTIENCHVLSGTIKESSKASGQACTGGLIGLFQEGEISLCSNNAEVISEVISAGSNIGGLIGQLDGTVDRCFNQGEITAKGAIYSQNVGGLVGFLSPSPLSKITNSYNIGDIKITDADEKEVYTGGIVGQNGRTIENCYSSANITGSNSENSFTGGLVGNISNYGTLKNSLSLSESITGYADQTGFLYGRAQNIQAIEYAWVKGANADQYDSGSDNDPNQRNGLLWSGSLSDMPFAKEGEAIWSTNIWNIDASGSSMPKIKDMLINQPTVSNPAKASDATYHTITLEVAADIDLYGMTAGAHQIEEGGHLHLQFMPEATTATADDILFLVDGVETEFTDFGAGKYFSYILNPVSGNHTILIAMKEYTVTLPEVEGVKINVGAGVHSVPYGEKFTFTLTLDDAIDPADVHVFANGIEVEPDALRATVLSYTIDKVITSIVVVIEGANPTGNAHIAEGDITLSIINDQLSIINSGSAVDVSVYTITGQNMVQLRGLRGSKTITLQPGIYLVKAGTQTWKVMVKG